jgi:hypothetical protein
MKEVNRLCHTWVGNSCKYCGIVYAEGNEMNTSKEIMGLKEAVETVLEGFTLPAAVRKILETAYYAKRSGSVGQASQMPGASGFTMACFNASDVPVGTDLYVTQSH